MKNMDDTRLRRYCRSSGFNLNALIYRFLVADNDLRSYFHFNPHCGIVTFLIFFFTIVIIMCSIASLSTLSTGEKIYHDLQNETDKKLPRKESVLNIRPAYYCIREHLKQTDIFQEKTKKMLYKEQLEVEIMNSRMCCIDKLLKPEAQSQWRRSRSPKMFCRIANPVVSK